MHLLRTVLEVESLHHVFCAIQLDQLPSAEWIKLSGHSLRLGIPKENLTPVALQIRLLGQWLRVSSHKLIVFCDLDK